MLETTNRSWAQPVFLLFSLLAIVAIGAGLSGCTVKAVGDPDRPITIKAHVTVDVRGLKETASNIEDLVSGGQPQS